MHRRWGSLLHGVQRAGVLAAAVGILALVGVPAPASLAQEPSPDACCSVAAEQPDGGEPTAAETAPSKPQQWRQVYRDWAERYVDPLRELLVPIVVIIAALLVAARMLTPLLNPWSELGAQERVFFLIAGLALITAAAILGAFVLPGGDAHAGLAVALGLAGTVLTSWAVAKRLRLTVEVTNAKGERDRAGTAHVVALLNELGAEPPKGLEVPRASDAQALDGALKLLPEGTIGKALGSAIEWLFGLSPWTVVVDQESDDVHTVEISRNGRSAGSAVIDRDQLGLRVPLPRSPGTSQMGGGDAAKEESLPDLHRLAAAVVLTTLARKHGGFEGLCGATDWRSLGLHYVATTDFEDTPTEAGRLLARAAELDPDNLSAQVAWRYAVYREATDAPDLAAYIRWLDDTIAHVTDGAVGGRAREGHAALRQRMRYSRAAATVNLFYANEGTFGFDARPPVQDRRRTRAAFELLLRELADGSGDEGLKRLRRAAWPGAAAMASWANEHLPAGVDRIQDDKIRSWLGRPAGPLGHYNLGCFHATRKEDPDHRRAVTHLRFATDVPRLRAWMPRDPQLRSVFEREPIYRKTFNPSPSKDLLSLPPLEPFAAAFKKAGATEFRSLRRYLAAPDALRHVVGPNRASARQVTETIQLAASLPGELASFRVELCRELFDRDVLDRLDELTVEQREELAGKMAGAIAKRCDSAPKRSAVAGWLQALSGA
jgi:hypothetical protein